MLLMWNNKRLYDIAGILPQVRAKKKGASDGPLFPGGVLIGLAC